MAVSPQWAVYILDSGFWILLCSTQIEADAAKVWGTGGAAGKENAPAPKVFSFVGKSAESVREDGCSRGMRVGVEYELAGQQCLTKYAGVYTLYSDYRRLNI